MKTIAVGASLFILTLVFVVPAGAKDITGLITAETDYGEQVQRACLIYCQGNRRKGTLEQIEIDRVHFSDPINLESLL